MSVPENYVMPSDSEYSLHHGKILLKKEVVGFRMLETTPRKSLEPIPGSWYGFFYPVYTLGLESRLKSKPKCLLFLAKRSRSRGRTPPYVMLSELPQPPGHYPEDPQSTYLLISLISHKITYFL